MEFACILGTTTFQKHAFFCVIDDLKLYVGVTMRINHCLDVSYHLMTG